MNKKILILILFLLPTFGMAEFISQHEYTHVRIFNEAGYQNVSINLKGGAFVTTAYANEFSDREWERTMNTFAEITGYHTWGIILNMWLVMFFILIVYLSVRNYERSAKNKRPETNNQDR